MSGGGSPADWKELLHKQKRMNELLEDIAEGIKYLVWASGLTDWIRPSEREEESV